MEIGNAFSELNDPGRAAAWLEDQVQRAQGGDSEAHPLDEDYIAALEYGLPPTGGLGIGIDRLVMILADAPSLREVILFPHLRRRRNVRAFRRSGPAHGGRRHPGARPDRDAGVESTRDLLFPAPPW
jgi:hypothetical protein